jgi:uncharacterized protein with gpF-like domain
MLKPRARVFKPRLQLEQAFQRELLKLVRSHLNQVDLGQLHILPSTIEQIGHDPAFIAASESLARRMVTGLTRENAASWRVAANRSMKGKQIYAALQEELAGQTGIRVANLVRDNTAKIVTVTQDIAQHITPIIARMQQEGVRSENIEPAIVGHLHELADWQVRRIARTQVAMSETDLTRARAERIGVRWYQWATSHDGRVRYSHRVMDNVLIRFDDPPSPELLAGLKANPRFPHYHAGQVYNCRCVALPVVSLDEISWPAPVYYNGSITRMTRKQFEAIH